MKFTNHLFLKNIILIFLFLGISSFAVCEGQVHDGSCAYADTKWCVGFENICNKFIRKEQLPKLRKLILCNRMDSIQICEYDLYVQQDSGYATFKVKQPELPAEVRNCIMNLKDNQYIIVDNIEIMTQQDGKRSIEGVLFQIKD